jgi:hypothetical protein
VAFTWIGVSNTRYGKRAFASGMQITIGNAAGVSAPFLYGQRGAPNYYAGYRATLRLLAVCVAVYITLHLWFRNATKRKLEGKEDYRMEGKTEEQVAEMGEDNPRFFYTIFR